MASGTPGDDKEKVAREAFDKLRHDDPFFMKLKHLLVHGKRAEAIKLIQNNLDFQTAEAQELAKLIMNTLSDTIIDP